MIVTIQHLRTVPTWTKRHGYCAKGARLFFERYNLDWAEFVNKGIEEQKLIATNDQLAINLVEHARKAEANNG